MSNTIIKQMPIPERKPFGARDRGSKYDTMLNALDVGDCIKLDGTTKAAYLRKLMIKRGWKVTQRVIDGCEYIWRTQ